jgi:hypothetical protein
MESNRVDDLSASLKIKSAGSSVGAQSAPACATTLSAACETHEATYSDSHQIAVATKE